MIEKHIININKDSDFDELSNFIDINIVQELKGYMSGKISAILVETPYYDSDYLSTYYCFYSRKHRHFPKESIRIHFYNHDEYCGYITVRPTMEGTNIGKSYLSAQAFCPNDSKVITNSFKVHMLGEENFVDSFPWMQQETDVAVCAHVAIWSILRYYGTKFANYHNMTMGNIVEQLPETMNRKIPTTAVNIQQIPDIFKKLGFTPIVVNRQRVGNDIFMQELLSYLDSGIPIIGCMSQKRHAISIIGYKKYGKDSEKFKKAIDNPKKRAYNSDLISELIVNDDNYFPYKIMGKREDFNPFVKEQVFDKNQKFIEDIDYLIIPLYDRMQYSYLSVKDAVEKYLDNENILENDRSYIIRPYITSANSLKEHSYRIFDDNSLWDEIPRISMPRFVWCIDISSVEEYNKGNTDIQMVIDTTCCNMELQPWIYVLTQDKFKRYDNYLWEEALINNKPFEMYNNLKRVVR